jgi:hypothetical protein
MTKRKAVIPDSIKRIVREPLLHFIVLGAALFLVYTALETDTESGSDYEIALTLDELYQLNSLFEAQWHRAPTPEEFAGMVETRVQQEVLYREALAMGLDKNDEIVKRRMAQKVRFLAEDMAAAQEPGREELEDWYQKNSDMFALPKRVSFRHLYFSPDSRGTRAHEDARAALARLAGKPVDSETADALADRFMYQDYYADQTSVSLAKDFGPQFAVAVASLPPGSWQGPVESGFGWHLVYIDSVIQGRVPAFDEVEGEVKTAWLGVQKEIGWEKAYREMRARYTLLIPVPVDDEALAESRAAPAAADIPMQEQEAAL